MRRFALASTGVLLLAFAWGCGNMQKALREVPTAVGTYVVTVHAISAAVNATSQLTHQVQVHVAVNGK
jgi:hypothetical protein